MDFMTEEGSVVTRMAPSPTGHLHVGTARTALYNYLFARRHNGKFILRSEDTDKARSTKESEDEILEGLSWLGLSWDEFYRQSERASIYRGYLERLVEEGTAYLSKEESRQTAGEMVEVVRLRNPNKVVEFSDMVRGQISFDSTELGDFVIARSLDDALYHFTVVVDDHEMGVTHVIRGEDHISNTPRQILIQEAIGATRPQYAHLPLILAPDRSKLSKRNGTVEVAQYRADGFLKESLVNYLAFLGWNPGTDKELYTLIELIQDFDIDGIQKGGAIFNMDKLKWFNKEHIRELENEAFFDIVLSRLPHHLRSFPQFSSERVQRLLPLIKERISVLNEITTEAENGEYDFAFKEPVVDPLMLKWKNDTTLKDALPRLQKCAELIATLPEVSAPEEVKLALFDYANEVGKGEVLWPLRVALTGRERSPDPFSVVYVIGSAEAYKRVGNACDTILRT